jgi:hypothetical protein
MGDDFIAEVVEWDGHHRLGLGAKYGQLLGGLVGELLLLPHPANRAVERVAGLDRLTQPVMGHAR